jgi:hypothetical protein
MRKLKVFVCIPPKGYVPKPSDGYTPKSCKEYLNDRKELIFNCLQDNGLLPDWRVKSSDDIVITSWADLDQDPPEYAVYDRLWHWGNDYKEIACCDAVIFMPGWDHALGCRKEFEMCVDLGIPYMFL